ncbi:MAG: hypothetical protein K1X64_10385 [Myxococcaceae bacterium]|nr:hypothetical protein [Myxococcaceae bacterium]
MSYLPDNASLEEQVQDCFLAYRGRGLSLSALDEELLARWAQAQVPFEVIARGIRKAAEAALWDRAVDDERIRSLAACKKLVEAEMHKFLRQSVGRPAPKKAEPSTEPLHLTRHKKLKTAVRKFARELGVSGERLTAWVKQLSTPDDLDRAQRQEELAVAHAIRLLPHFDRLTLLKEAARLMPHAKSMSPKARLESRRFHRAALLRRQCNFPSFW